MSAQHLLGLVGAYEGDILDFDKATALVSGCAIAFEQPERLARSSPDELSELMLRSSVVLPEAMTLGHVEASLSRRLLMSIPHMITELLRANPTEHCWMFWDRLLWEHHRPTERWDVLVEGALDALELQARSPSAAVRKSALYGLQMLKESERAERVIRSLASDSDDDVRSSAQLILDGGRI
jgi:hypothetical protein